MNVDLLGQAVASLRLRDIVLYTSRFSRPSSPSNPLVQGITQSKRQVQFGRGIVDEEGATKHLLQVLVELGIRIVGDEQVGDDQPVFVEIEADFLAEYELVSEVSDEAIKLFAEVNSVHNVWPFWRQHVFDVVQRGRLPPIVIPLFAGSMLKQSADEHGVSVNPRNGT